MTNLEGIAKQLLNNNISDRKIVNQLMAEYRVFKKDYPKARLLKMAEGVLQESKKSLSAHSNPLIKNDKLLSTLLNIPKAGVSMGEGGVGCRGKGDFFVHELLTKISKTSVDPLISPESLDDTGAVEVPFGSNAAQLEKTGTRDMKGEKAIILTKMEGMHSRLSDFPFLAGFHVTRAALRDVYVKGGVPTSIMVDVHLADDGDIGKLFDFQAGISAVAELAGVPITAGSTLRIGGDMVIGDRLTGGIAAIGTMKYSFFRKNVQKGDVILMTGGAGGGTISTTALYADMPEVVKKTLNIDFLRACENILADEQACNGIRAMADVTNGGLRGDLYEINKETGYGVQIRPDIVKGLVDSAVISLLENTGVDYLGVSLDALLMFCSPNVVSEIKYILREQGIQVRQIGKVTESQKVVFISPDGEKNIQPRFRESAYTEIKKIVDEDPEDMNEMEAKIMRAFKETQQKKKYILEEILGREKTKHQ